MTKASDKINATCWACTRFSAGSIVKTHYPQSLYPGVPEGERPRATEGLHLVTDGSDRSWVLYRCHVRVAEGRGDPPSVAEAVELWRKWRANHQNQGAA